MCVPACVIQLAEAASRRQFLRRGAAACAIAAAAPNSGAAPPVPSRFERVVDLTHTLGPSFPMTWPQPFAMEPTSRLGKDKWNAFRWHIQEHSGTHIDAPFHCTHGPTADRIPIEDLVGPLVVIDVRSRAVTDADTQLTPDDLKTWENQHGPIPDGAIVAMLSGWDTRVNDATKFFGLDDHGRYHSPGFHVEAVRFLTERRNVKGIAVDTISLDPGNSTDFTVHHHWLGHNKWGLENVANLAQLPPSGATIIVGAPKIAGASGGPSRVIALV